MKKLFTNEEFNKSIGTIKFKLECEFCNKSFEMPKVTILASLKKNRTLSYCSKKCRSFGLGKRIKKTCKTCNKEIIINLRKILNSKNHFCSSICYNIHQKLLPTRPSQKKPSKDITGKQFGDLIVLRMERTCNSKHGEFRAICKCLRCGKENCDIRPAWLKKSIKINCGCHTDYIKPTGKNSPFFKGYEEIFHSHFNNPQKRALKNGWDFDIDLKFLWELFLKQNKKCALSGLSIGFSKKKRDKLETASLDRINSKKGYTKDNVQWVHKEINWMKKDIQNKEFIDICKMIVDKHEYILPS